MTSDASQSPADRRSWWLAALVLVLGIAAVYARVGSFEFVLFDDNAYVYENPVVPDGLTGAGIRWAFTEAYSNNWHPLTWVSHMLDVEIFGLDAGAHHWANAVYHALGTLLLLAWLARIGFGPWVAFVVAALFAWHPLRVESVAWVSERKDLLSGALAFATLHLYTSWVRRGGAGLAVAWTACLGLGLLAKPMLVTLPVVLLALDAWPLRRTDRALRDRVVEKLPAFGLALGSAVATVLVQRASGAVQSIDAFPLLDRIENALWTLVVYPWQTLVPRDLAILYPHPALDPNATGLHLRALAGVVLAVAFSAFAWRRRERAPWILVGWIWYLVMLAPVIGILQVGEQAHADRYTYLPTIGLFLALAGGLTGWLDGARARTPVRVALLLWVAALGWLASVQTAVWRDSGTLFRHSIETTGGTTLAHLNLGRWLHQEGRLPEALAATRRAVELDPEAPAALYNLGVQEAASGNPAAAEAAFRRTLAADPENADAHNRLATIQFARGDTAGAGRDFEAAARLAPERPDLQANLGRFRAATGDLRGARAPFEAALRASSGPLQPEDRRLLARARSADGDAAGALQLLRALRSERPDDPQVAGDLAWLLATAPDEALRSAREAVGLAEALLRTPNAPRAQLLPLWAAALAADDRFEEAVSAQEEVVQRARGPARAVETERLGRYRRGEALWLATGW